MAPGEGRRATNRQGDRGSVALIGPTRSGKTVLASAGIIGWDGPVVALSVKRDLHDTTAAARAVRGELAVFDPGGVTGLPSARWTPLRDVTTTSGAARAGRALAQAIPRNGKRHNHRPPNGEMPNSRPRDGRRIRIDSRTAAS